MAHAHLVRHVDDIRRTGGFQDAVAIVEEDARRRLVAEALGVYLIEQEVQLVLPLAADNEVGQLAAQKVLRLVGRDHAARNDDGTAPCADAPHDLDHRLDSDVEQA